VAVMALAWAKMRGMVDWLRMARRCRSVGALGLL
jgi:hypothetical protein